MIFKWNGKNFLNDLTNKLNDKIEEASELVKQYMKESLTPNKHGRHYNEKSNRSSAINEAPASQTGGLFNSIKVNIFPSELKGEIGSSSNYAINLEFGIWSTKAKKFWKEPDEGFEAGVAPRPFLRPALEKSIADIKRIFKTDTVIVKWL